MENYVRIHCKQSTRIFYESYLNRHILPVLGEIPIKKITSKIITDIIAEKIEKEYSNKTINHIITIIEIVFNYLIKQQQISNSPVSKIKRLKLEYKEMNFLNKNEVQKLLKFCSKEKPELYAIIATAIFTGLRQGELLALTWDDILFERNKINITKSIHRGVVTSPKSEKSIRLVDMPTIVVKALKEQKLKVGNKSNIVFCNKKWVHQCPDNLRKRHYKPLMERFGLPNIRFHDLRHTYASLLISENLPIKYIQRQMGHSSIDVTMDTYGHILPDVHDNAIKVLDQMMMDQKNEKAKKIN